MSSFRQTDAFSPITSLQLNKMMNKQAYVSFMKKIKTSRKVERSQIYLIISAMAWSEGRTHFIKVALCSSAESSTGVVQESRNLYFNSFIGHCIIGGNTG